MDLGVAMSRDVFEDKLDHARDGKGPEATWSTRRLPKQLTPRLDQSSLGRGGRSVARLVPAVRRGALESGRRAGALRAHLRHAAVDAGPADADAALPGLAIPTGQITHASGCIEVAARHVGPVTAVPKPLDGVALGHSGCGAGRHAGRDRSVVCLGVELLCREPPETVRAGHPSSRRLDCTSVGGAVALGIRQRSDSRR